MQSVDFLIGQLHSSSKNPVLHYGWLFIIKSVAYHDLGTNPIWQSPNEVGKQLD